MKKTVKLLIALVLAFSMLLCAVSCFENEDEKESKQEQTQKSDNNDSSESANASEKTSSKSTKQSESSAVSYKNRSYSLRSITSKLKLIGRTQLVEKGITCDFTASGIAFNAYVEDKLTLTLDVEKATTYFTVYVDGVRQETRYSADVGENRTIVINGLGDMALREIRILKQNQPQRSLTVLKNLSFYGQIDSAVKDKDLYFEIIGDSITCGHGNLCANKTDGEATTLYEDGTQAYAFLTAEKFDADYSILGCSGIGIDGGWTYPLNELGFYPKTSYYRSNSDNYNFANARKPDAVIINLGTNDGGATIKSTETKFKANARELINFIRTQYGADTPIIWAYGMMGTATTGTVDWSNWIEEIATEFTGVYTKVLPKNSDGGQGHPTVEGHEAAAQELYEFILNCGAIG